MNNKISTIIINLAGAYQIVGKFNLSQSYLEILLKEDQNNALAHKMLSTIKKYKKNDPHQITNDFNFKKKLFKRN